MPKKNQETVSTNDIVNGIAAALSNTHDGAVDADGKPVEIGLKREDGCPLLDKRVADGFSVKLHGTKLCIIYQLECRLKDVHEKGFENDVKGTMANIESYIKKEYRKATGHALNLKKEEDIDIDVQYLSRVRTTVRAMCWYEVKNYTDVEAVGDPSDENRIDNKFKDFLALGAKEDKK